MKEQAQAPRSFVSVVLLVLSCGILAFAQDGKLIIHVIPKQAYIFADGRAAAKQAPHPDSQRRRPQD